MSRISSTCSLSLFCVISIGQNRIVTFQVYQIDKEQRSVVHEEERKEEPQSTLARRRAERIKHKSEPKIEKDPRILHRILLCCAWNGGTNFLLQFWLFF